MSYLEGYYDRAVGSGSNLEKLKKMASEGKKKKKKKKDDEEEVEAARPVPITGRN